MRHSGEGTFKVGKITITNNMRYSANIVGATGVNQIIVSNDDLQFNGGLSISNADLQLVGENGKKILPAMLIFR